MPVDPGCGALSKKTFEAAAASGNDLLVQVKDNQPGLRQAVIALTQSAKPLECTTTVDLDRRRHTQRTVRVFAAAGLPTPWAEHIKAVIEVQRLTDTLGLPDKTSCEPHVVCF